ncbi:MAG: hypothetical protein MJ210_03720 [Alphaproteobacteria bacterium]|nr:hypothetical protein [Alphaproteobacteria bacterium]
MKKLLVLIFFCICFAFVLEARAVVSNYADAFDVNLEEDSLPSMDKLQEVFDKTDIYDAKYTSFYDLLNGFDKPFYLTLATYGSTEKRAKWEDEEVFLEFLRLVPKEYYQYFGPMLFEVPDMSEKVLNLPGIKETKNKFPTRIAEEVKDIKDLEFMSPAYYYLLMPEMWPSYKEKIEQPQMTPYFPKVRYNPKFYEAIKKLVKPEKYMPGYKEKAGKTKSDLRTLYPTKDSLLTSADIKAFTATIDAVDEWAQKLENQYALVKVAIMWSALEKEDGSKPFVHYSFKDLANPCVRLVQKARIVGKELELARLVAPQGFTLNEWAYTCDKSIKAYRLGNISTPVMQVVREYQRGIYDDEIKGITPYTQNMRFTVMQFIIQSYKAPLSDVMEYKKNRREFDEKIKNHGFQLFGFPITRF